MEIIIKIDAAELSEDMLAQIIQKGAKKDLSLNAGAKTSPSTEAPSEDNATDAKSERQKAADRKTEIVARLNELGAELPKKGSKLPTYEKALAEAETKTSEPEPEEAIKDDSWEDSEEEAEEATIDYDYAKVHALAKSAVSVSEEKGALMRRLLDQHIADGIGLKDAVAKHADKLPTLVAELENIAGTKYGE